VNNELRKDIVENIVKPEYGFVNLDVNSLIRDENERRTTIGQEFKYGCCWQNYPSRNDSENAKKNHLFRRPTQELHTLKFPRHYRISKGI